jgi:hypothetical protein
MGGLGQLAHHLAALTRRQLRIDHLLDQLITEQPNPAGSFGPAAPLIIGL